jgi:hypothetical protein
MTTRERGQPILGSFNPLSFTLSLTLSLQYNKTSNHSIVFGCFVVAMKSVHHGCSLDAMCLSAMFVVTNCGGESMGSEEQTGDWQTQAQLQSATTVVYCRMLLTAVEILVLNCRRYISVVWSYFILAYIYIYMLKLNNKDSYSTRTST